MKEDRSHAAAVADGRLRDQDRYGQEAPLRCDRAADIELAARRIKQLIPEGLACGPRRSEKRGGGRAQRDDGDALNGRLVHLAGTAP